MPTRTKTFPIPGVGEILELAENATMRLPRGRSPTVVRVEHGTVVLTREGDPEDYVLESGDELVLKPGPLAVGWALTKAMILVREAVVGRLEHRPPALPSAGRARKLMRRLLDAAGFRAPREERAIGDGPHAPDRWAA